MAPKRRYQFRIAQLFWCTLVVAAFLGGRHWHRNSGSRNPPAPLSPVPLAADFAVPLEDLSQESATFSFYVSFAR